MFGFLNVYKPKGKTSHDVVAILRRVTKIRQIGHTGTLDPFAEGVLPICIGKATRLAEYLNDDKAYIGTVQFGKSTTTYDIEGEIVNSSDKIVTMSDIERELKNFNGEIEQLPPIYSAVKINGKKLYEYARSGKEDEIIQEVKPRKVIIKEIKILNYDTDLRRLDLYIACSKGTYIRSIANDLGERLGVFGHLIKLVRVQAGSFKIENSTKLEDLEKIEQVENRLIHPLECLNYPEYELSLEEAEKISHGNPVYTNKEFENKTILLTKQNELAAIGEFGNNLIKCKKVFI